eukprot:TRINITY_DN15699_c0_g2_i2.p1 TRINITY_DN15699_c0_g2~~TRINITY_DN15699_c0_g2_i2.p1  ORF type:complete len:474 (+),score=56.17 TRINITY_DN15699_c0_g2_i2:132-1553(+)
MGVRKKAKKRKGKDQIGKKPTRVTNKTVKAVANFARDNFASSVLTFLDDEECLKTQFVNLCKYRELGVTDAVMRALLVAIPIELLLYEDEQGFNLLMVYLTRSDIEPSIIVKLIDRLLGTSGDVFLTDRLGTKMTAKALDLALVNGVSSDLIVVLFERSGFLTKFREYNRAREIIIPEVERHLTKIEASKHKWESVYRGSEYPNNFEVFNHEEFRTLLNMHHLILVENQEYNNFKERDYLYTYQEVTDFLDAFKENYMAVKDEMRSRIYFGTRARVQDLLDEVYGRVVKDDLKFAWDRMIEVDAITDNDVIPVSKEYITFLNKVHQHLESMLLTQQTRSRDPKDFEALRNIMVMTIRGIKDYVSLTPEEGSRHTDFAKMVALCYYFEGQFFQGIHFIRNTFGKCDDVENKDYLHLLKARMYYGLQKGHPKVAECLSQIQNESTFGSPDFKHFMIVMSSMLIEETASYFFDFQK